MRRLLRRPCLPLLLFLAQFGGLHRLVVVRRTLGDGKTVQVPKEFRGIAMAFSQRVEGRADNLLFGHLRVPLAHSGQQRLRLHTACRYTAQGVCNCLKRRHIEPIDAQAPPLARRALIDIRPAQYDG